MIHVFVIGDIIVDHTSYGKVSGPAAEDSSAAVFVPAERTQVSLGGAGRILRYLQQHTLNDTVFRFSFHGLAPQKSEALFKEFDDASWVRSLFWLDHIYLESKLRFVSESGLILRVDGLLEFCGPGATQYEFLPSHVRDAVIQSVYNYRARVEEHVDRCVYLLVDYGKGALPDTFWAPFLNQIRETDILFIDDSISVAKFDKHYTDTRRYGLGLLPTGTEVVYKINESRFVEMMRTSDHEWASYEVTGKPADRRDPFARVFDTCIINNTDYIHAVSDQVRTQLGFPARFLLVTCGATGAFLLDLKGETCVVQENTFADKSSPGYPCGCGDVFTAAFVAMLTTYANANLFSLDNQSRCLSHAVRTANAFAKFPADCVADL